MTMQISAKKIAVLLMLLTSATTYCQENTVDEVVWVVGDEAILKSQVEEQRMRMQYENERINGDPYCVIPEQMAIQKLFMHQAKLDSINVPDNQIFQQVDGRINYMISQIGSKEKMEEYFKKGYSQIREEMIETVREQATVQEMQQKLIGKVKTTPNEVRKFYERLPSDSIPFIPGQVEVQIITLQPRIQAEEIDNIKSRLREYSERVLKGESQFSTLAILYSQDPGSSRVGGELGFMGKGELLPEFANVAFSLNDPKKVSKIVETEFGYHIIQLIEKRGDRVNVRHILLKPEANEKEVKDAMTKIDSLRKDIVAEKIKFEEAALYVSHDKDSRNNGGLMVNAKNSTTRFEMQDLPQEIAKKVASMKVGDLSAPFLMVNERLGKESVAIVRLKNRIEGHKANMNDDYQSLKFMVENKHKEQIIQDWIKEKQKHTYIRIKEGWRNCEFQYKGWIIQ